MKTIKDKQVLVAADFAGATLKNAVVTHLEAKGWTVTDIGVKDEDEKNPSKCPHVHAAVVESPHAALRAITGNNCNVLAMGGSYVAPALGIEMADLFLEHNMGDGYEWWPNFYEFHKLAYDELEAFDYEEYKKNGFELKHLGDIELPNCLKPDSVK
jgi:ribose 5-phosphate isomerase B